MKNVKNKVIKELPKKELIRIEGGYNKGSRRHAIMDFLRGRIRSIN